MRGYSQYANARSPSRRPPTPRGGPVGEDALALVEGGGRRFESNSRDGPRLGGRVLRRRWRSLARARGRRSRAPGLDAAPAGWKGRASPAGGRRRARGPVGLGAPSGGEAAASPRARAPSEGAGPPRRRRGRRALARAGRQARPGPGAPRAPRTPAWCDARRCRVACQGGPGPSAADRAGRPRSARWLEDGRTRPAAAVPPGASSFHPGSRPAQPLREDAGARRRGAARPG